MTFGQRGAGFASNAPKKEYLTDVEPKPFKSGHVFLSALVGSMTFFILGSAYMALFAIHRVGFPAAEKAIVSMLVLGIPATSLFYLVGLSLSDLTFRTIRKISISAYSLAGIIIPSLLVTLFQFAMSKGQSGNYIVLAVIAPGGLVAGILLGLLRRRSFTDVG